MTERIETEDPETFLYWVAEEIIDFTGLVSHSERSLTPRQISKKQELLKKITFPQNSMVYEEYILRAWETIEDAVDGLISFKVTRRNLNDFKKLASSKFDDLTTFLDSDSLVLKPDYREFRGTIEL